MNMAASWGKSSSRQIGERFLTTFAKLKVVSPTAMAKLVIDSASLVSWNKSGDFNSKSGDCNIAI